MKRTIYLPDDIAERLNQYLINYPNETFSSVIQEALEAKLAQKDVSKLLSLAGILQNVSCNAADNAEDRINYFG